MLLEVTVVGDDAGEELDDDKTFDRKLTPFKLLLPVNSITVASIESVEIECIDEVPKLDEFKQRVMDEAGECVYQHGPDGLALLAEAHAIVEHEGATYYVAETYDDIRSALMHAKRLVEVHGS